MLKIKVPATTANMGPGFDCIGMALQLYNTLWVEEISKGLQISSLNGQSAPQNESNLIYKTIVGFYRKMGKSLPGLRLIQEDYIPFTKGLGSSAACIVAGLLAANVISGANLSQEEILQMAGQIEGHPDNSTPALLGGMTVGILDENRVKYAKVNISDELIFAVMIPNFPLPTEKAREVVPKQISLQDSIFNTSRAALLTAAMIQGDWELLQVATEDRIHQPYRKAFMPDMESIFNKSKALGAKGVFLSGAGPTLIGIVKEAEVEPFKCNMEAYLNSLSSPWELKLLKADHEGAQIEIESRR
jgi:homoserine kinase